MVVWTSSDFTDSSIFICCDSSFCGCDGSCPISATSFFTSSKNSFWNLACAVVMTVSFADWIREIGTSAEVKVGVDDLDLSELVEAVADVSK